MNLQKRFSVFFVATLLVSWLDPVSAAELCKWVDENGTVHYADTCPDSVESGTVNVEEQDPATRGDDPYADSRARLEQRGKETQEPVQPGTQPMIQAPDFSGMSPAQLASECERQREARLGPERQRLVAQCKAQGEKSASACERFYTDWGNGGVRGGHTVGRKYDNLPVCVAARGEGR